MKKIKGIYGDMFRSGDTIYRIYTNHHPKNAFIAYPIYNIEGNLIKKITDKKAYKKHYKKIGSSNINLPIILRKNIDEYFNCMNVDLNPTNDYFKDIIQIVEKLNSIGIKNIGLTGSGLLENLGYKKKNSKKKDIDIIVYGRKDSKQLRAKQNDLFKQGFISYVNYPSKIYQRRKEESGPFSIDLKTALNFEAKKPIGIFKGRHINITPTYVGDDNVFGLNLKIKDLGLIKTEIKLKDIKHSYSVPGYYKIKAKHRNKNIGLLKTNFFYYSLGGNIGDKFEVCGNLIEEKIDGEEKYHILLESWGKTKKYFMNIIS